VWSQEWLHQSAEQWLWENQEALVGLPKRHLAGGTDSACPNCPLKCLRRHFRKEKKNTFRKEKPRVTISSVMKANRKPNPRIWEKFGHL
jgi:hypothetical protein